MSAKSKKSLVFAEFMSEFPLDDEETIIIDTFPNDHIFLITSIDPWYDDILVYL